MVCAPKTAGARVLSRLTAAVFRSVAAVSDDYGYRNRGLQNRGERGASRASSINVRSRACLFLAIVNRNHQCQGQRNTHRRVVLAQGVEP